MEQLLSRTKVKKKKEECSKFDSLGLPAGQNEVSYFIANRIKYLVICHLLIKKKKKKKEPFCQFPENMQALGFGIKVQVDKTLSESLTCILVLPSRVETQIP